MRRGLLRVCVCASMSVTMLVVFTASTAASVTIGTESHYRFAPIAFLTDPAPGGGNFINDFEPSAVNDRGQVAFTADLSLPTAGNEGVFLGRRERIVQLARNGLPAPGGGVFSAGEFGRIGLNQSGNASFAFSLAPWPTGVASGVYRYEHDAQALTALMHPGQAAPGGGTFTGAGFHTAINNHDDTVFTGIVSGACVDRDDPNTSPCSGGAAKGVFRADEHGAVAAVVRPGDLAPGGGVFDYASNGSINDAGLIAFGAHIQGEHQADCQKYFGPLDCPESLYLRSPHGVRSIAHAGQPSPCAGTPYRLAFGGLLNERGDLLFIGDLTPRTNPPFQHTGVFLVEHGTTFPVACPGDPMPGGGRLVSAPQADATYSLNNRGQVSYAAALSTFHGFIPDTGVYISSKGSTRLVARTGTVIPGVGTIAGLEPPGFSGPAPTGQTGGEINNRGQVLFAATLTDGRVVLLLATPDAR